MRKMVRFMIRSDLWKCTVSAASVAGATLDNNSIVMSAAFLTLLSFHQRHTEHRSSSAKTIIRRQRSDSSSHRRVMTIDKNDCGVVGSVSERTTVDNMIDTCSSYASTVSHNEHMRA